jgi:hypothetical protein
VVKGFHRDADPETALNDSAFKPVWDVIKALRSHDDELGEQLDELRRQLGRHDGGRLRHPPKIHLDLPARVAFRRKIALELHRYWCAILGLNQ